MTLEQTKLHLKALQKERELTWEAARLLSVEITKVINELTNWNVNHPPTLSIVGLEPKV